MKIKEKLKNPSILPLAIFLGVPIVILTVMYIIVIFSLQSLDEIYKLFPLIEMSILILPFLLTFLLIFFNKISTKRESLFVKLAIAIPFILLFLGILSPILLANVDPNNIGVFGVLILPQILLFILILFILTLEKISQKKISTRALYNKIISSRKRFSLIILGFVIIIIGNLIIAEESITTIGSIIKIGNLIIAEGIIFLILSIIAFSYFIFIFIRDNISDKKEAFSIPLALFLVLFVAILINFSPQLIGFLEDKIAFKGSLMIYLIAFSLFLLIFTLDKILGKEMSIKGVFDKILFSKKRYALIPLFITIISLASLINIFQKDNYSETFISFPIIIFLLSLSFFILILVWNKILIYRPFWKWFFIGLNLPLFYMIILLYILPAMEPDWASVAYIVTIIKAPIIFLISVFIGSFKVYQKNKKILSLILIILVSLMLFLIQVPFVLITLSIPP